MGCCFSRPAGPNSPYPGGAQSGSARAINPPPANASSVDEASAAAAAAARRRPHSSQPLSQHIDKRLRRHVWTSRNRSWSRSSITREREDFFDTRVTGRPEVWQALRAAIDVLLSSASDDDEALATAQSIIRAAEITLPTGDLANGAYDSLGNYYPVPEWVVADPGNLIDDGSPDVSRKGGAINSEGSDDEVDEENEEDDDLLEIERRREEKGKAVIDVRDQIIVKARLSENARDISISIDKKDTVRVLARKILIESGLPSKKKIRIAYMGKILKENVSLVDHGWKQGHVVNALVFNR